MAMEICRDALVMLSLGSNLACESIALPQDRNTRTTKISFSIFSLGDQREIQSRLDILSVPHQSW